MTLRSRRNPVSTIEIRARGYVRNSKRDVDQVEEFEEGEANEGGADEASIFLAPFVAREGTCFSILEGCDP